MPFPPTSCLQLQNVIDPETPDAGSAQSESTVMVFSAEHSLNVQVRLVSDEGSSPVRSSAASAVDGLQSILPARFSKRLNYSSFETEKERAMAWVDRKPYMDRLRDLKGTRDIQYRFRHDRNRLVERDPVKVTPTTPTAACT